MEISFNNKRILVTGAGQGIGRELAKRLVKYGAEVVAISKTQSYLESLKSELPSVKIIGLDISNWEETRKVVEASGPFHGVVNNAGLAILEPFLDATEKSFDRLFNVNVKAIFNVSQVASKQMVANQIKGSIVNISSHASQCALQDHLIYCSTKAALDMMTKVMAVELGGYGIRVNSVNPTVVMTAMGQLGWSDPKKANPMLEKIPLHRFVDVDEVVDAIVYLLSDKSSMVNAIRLPVDGGLSAY